MRMNCLHRTGSSPHGLEGSFGYFSLRHCNGNTITGISPESIQALCLNILAFDPHNCFENYKPVLLFDICIHSSFALLLFCSSFALSALSLSLIFVLDVHFLMHYDKPVMLLLFSILDFWASLSICSLNHSYISELIPDQIHLLWWWLYTQLPWTLTRFLHTGLKIS